MFETPAYLTVGDGARIAYRRAPAKQPAVGILIVQHGLSEHSHRYLHFSEAMSAAGFHVYANDHRGHGLTRCPQVPQGRFALTDGVERVLMDTKALRDLAVANHPSLPVLLFGHSMGGLIALRAAVRYADHFQGLAIWNSNFNTGLAGRLARLLLLLERALKGSDVPSQILPRATFDAWGKAIADRRTPHDWLSHDREAVDRYAADPLCQIKPSVSMWLDVLDFSNRTATTDNLRRLPRNLPVHLVGGGEDPATNGAKATEWLADKMRSAGLMAVTLKIYRSMRHETLQELGREEATLDFIAWAREAMAAPPMPGDM